MGFGFALVSKRLDPGSSTLARDDTVLWFGVLYFGVGLVVSKRLDSGSATPKGAPSARDDTVCSLLTFVSGLLSAFHHSTDFTRECQITNCK